MGIPETGRERIMLAAETLIAERGLGVSLRDIANAAGQRNNSAVHYHFGSRDGLIEAIITRHVKSLESRQMALLAQAEANGTADQVKSLVEVMVRPMFEVPYANGSTHYARFLELVRSHDSLTESSWDSGGWATVSIVMSRLKRALSHLPREVLERRLSSLMTVASSLIADQERRIELTGGAMADDECVIEDIISMIVALLMAPSEASKAHLTSA